MNESEGTEEIKKTIPPLPLPAKTFPLYPYLLQGQQALPNCKPVSVGHPGDVRYMTHLPHPTTPNIFMNILGKLGIGFVLLATELIPYLMIHRFPSDWRIERMMVETELLAGEVLM